MRIHCRCADHQPNRQSCSLLSARFSSTQHSHCARNPGGIASHRLAIAPRLGNDGVYLTAAFNVVHKGILCRDSAILGFHIFERICPLQLHHLPVINSYIINMNSMRVMICTWLPHVVHGSNEQVVILPSVAQRFSCRFTPFSLQRAHVCLAELRHVQHRQAVLPQRRMLQQSRLVLLAGGELCWQLAQPL